MGGAMIKGALIVTTQNGHIYHKRTDSVEIHFESSIRWETHP